MLCRVHVKVFFSFVIFKDNCDLYLVFISSIINELMLEIYGYLCPYLFPK